MTFARTLPAALAPRFAGARRALARTSRGSFELVLAESFMMRLRGLAALDPGEMVPLLFPGCRSLHTFWMKAPIDVIWLDLRLEGTTGEAEVLSVVEALGPRATARPPRGLSRAVRRRVAALELPPGGAAAGGLEGGVQLTLGVRSAPSG